MYWIQSVLERSWMTREGEGVRKRERRGKGEERKGKGERKKT